MKAYIDKSALVAEIERQKIGYNVDGKHSIEYDTTRKILNIIDTIEVKEINSTNAFIEKACAYLDSIGHRYIIDAFRKYMEKE